MHRARSKLDMDDHVAQNRAYDPRSGEKAAVDLQQPLVL